ncbi:hypothetical protein AVEN_73703-1 [Araneus ventricosus]|uniref:Transcriptional coactivator p15 (PC4) C-terminal domain-containing protein n=1 Tax=Araneus ventricosus TaxID=182803 RepID=A0A4Y2HQY4_ARAVE|nr:hypothetical protein AVEN_73703-1 [Araneus ventricosus]
MANCTDGNLKLKGTISDASTKKVRFSDNVEVQRIQSLSPNLKMDSLPSDLLHLGGDVFTYLNTFRKQTHVHIQHFSEDSSGVQHPTKNGVSLKLSVWSDLLRKLCHFRLTDSDAVLAIKKGVSVFNQTVDDNVCVVMQRLYQKKDLSYKLLPEKFVLRDVEFHKFCGSHERVLEIIKNKLLSYTLKE